MLCNVVGQRFGRLIVIERGLDYRYNYGYKLGRLAQWFCLCDCGNKILTTGNNLRKGNTTSCGCVQKEVTVKRSTIHGGAKRSGWTNEYQMWLGAKQRAKRAGLRFDLKISDIVIPEFCPVLGIRLVQNNKKSFADSPSLDRIFPERGYARGNVQVISHKANTIKNNSTIEDLEKVLNYSRNSEVFAYA
jgi:hypothetical protein